MKILFKFLYLAGILIVNFNPQALGKPQVDLATTSSEIKLLPESNTTFTTQITLHVAEKHTNWRFGFFMFHVLSNPNKPNTISICKTVLPTSKSTHNDKKTKPDCTQLIIDANPYSQIAEQFIQPDIHLGHIAVLKPQDKFSLQPGEDYLITIKGLKNIPQNITAIPQKLFLYNPAKRLVTNIAVTSYLSKAYDNLKVESQIKTHIANNWNNAKQVGVVSGVVPLPRHLNYEDYISPRADLLYQLHTQHIESNLAMPYHGVISLYIENPQLRGWLKDITKLPVTTQRRESTIRFLSCLIPNKDNKPENNSNMSRQGEVLDKQAIYRSIPVPGLKLCSQIKNQLEGYVLTVTKAGVDIYANNQTGWFYASQTLMQMLNYGGIHCRQALHMQISCNLDQKWIPSKITLKFQTIVDYPRFKYRGIMLDTVRHFFGYKELKRFIDVMAAHKLNALHLHLADDEGWRLELPNYPALTKLGATRGLGQRMGAANIIDDKFDISNLAKQRYANVNTKYTGYYTVGQMKELVKYANSRQITLIPEIEMPGHARAMKKAMPEVFFDGADRSDAYSVQGYNDNVLPACKYGRDSKFTNAINGLIIDIAKLFAGQTTPYFMANEVSLSGDELAEGSLNRYPLCKSGIWANLNTFQIEHMFFKQIANRLPEYKLSGWQQLVQDDDGIISQNVISKHNVGHIWAWMPTTSKPMNGYEMVASLTKSGYNTVLAFADYTYFDIRYSPQWNEPGLYWSTSYVDTNKVLQSGQLISKKLGDISYIDGLEGALWSELLPSNEHLWYMALPKMSALAEAAWSNESDLNWRSLATRLGCGKTGFLAYLKKQYKVNYRGYPNGIKLEIPSQSICSIN